MRHLPLALLCAVAALPAPAGAAAPRSVPGGLADLRDGGLIDAATHDRHRATYDRARETLKRLSGARASTLRAVLANVEAIARGKRFTPDRLPVLFLTVERNRAWWAARPWPAAGQRVSFAGSRLVWQYYRGQGFQIQWLGTFGKANGLFQSGNHDDELAALLDEALPLAAARAGGTAFEYLFRFDGGRPPWVSGLAQGTAVQALARAAVRLGEPRYFEAARAGLAIFRTAPPEGVRVDEPEGPHYLIYSFWPRLRVLNGFVQALNGLHDFAALANDAEGRTLFAAGEARLRAELARYDTGAWSRYSNLSESDLGYHKVVRDFLRGLCDRLTRDGATAPVGDPATGGAAPPPQAAQVPDPAPYCNTHARFSRYLREGPALELRSTRATVGARGPLRFSVSKPATVWLSVVRGGAIVAARSARFGSGRHAFAFKPARPGPYTVRLRAVDLAGNAGYETGMIRATMKRP